MGKEKAIRGFLVYKKYVKQIVDVKKISPRVIYIILHLNTKYSIKIIQTYAPTSDYSEQEVENYYEDISTPLQEGTTRFTLLIGDFNVKIGGKRDEAETAIGQHGLGERNERGTTLIEFLHHNNLYAMNTFFKKNNIKKWTWMSPDGKTKNTINFICSNRTDII